MYFSQINNGITTGGEVLRYDTTKEFESVEAWSTFDPSKNGVGIRPMGFQDISFDGQFLYFAPRLVGSISNEILRYDTTKDFESVEAWGTFDPSKNGLGIDAVGYSGIIFDGDSIYLVPFFHNDLVPHGNVLKFQAWK